MSYEEEKIWKLDQKVGGDIQETLFVPFTTTSLVNAPRELALLWFRLDLYIGRKGGTFFVDRGKQNVMVNAPKRVGGGEEAFSCGRENKTVT